MSPYQVVRGPLITEKSETIRAEEHTLCFKVHPEATKTDVKNAIHKIFNVHVDSVRTSNFIGKMKRRGRYSGRQAKWKKAYVKLKAGEKMIEYARI